LIITSGASEHSDIWVTRGDVIRGTSMNEIHVYVFCRGTTDRRILLVLMIYGPRHQIVNDTRLTVRHTILCTSLW